MATKRNSKSGSPASIEGQNDVTLGSSRRRRSAVVASPDTNAPVFGRPRRTKASAAAVPVSPSSVKARQQSAGLSERERIALLAYSFWEARGRQGGSPEEDWFRAEREIRNGSSTVLTQ